MNKMIKTKRFILRPWRKTDAKNLAVSINDEAIYHYTSHIPYPYKLSDAKKWLGKRQKDELSLAIVIDNKIAGCVSLMRIIPGHKAEIGYWISHEFRGQGIIPHAVKKIISYGYKKYKLKKVYARVFAYNIASAKVLKKVGFIEEGLARKEHKKDGKLIDVRYFGYII